MSKYGTRIPALWLRGYDAITVYESQFDFKVFFEGNWTGESLCVSTVRFRSQVDFEFFQNLNVQAASCKEIILSTRMSLILALSRFFS